MRVLSIAAGAASMYCGSCLRDNAIAAELIARGHDVTLLPLYTPLLTDEPNVSRPEVLFGGINIYLQQRSALFRKTPRFVDRLLDSPRLINALASRSVSTDPRLLGDLTISTLGGRDGPLRKEFEKLLDWVAGEPKPDVVNITNSMLIALAQPLGSALRRPICCTLQGEDLFLNGLVEPYRTRAVTMIREMVPHVDHFVAVSEFYARFMREYLQIPADRMSVVPIGINMSEYDAAPKRPVGSSRSANDPFRVGYFARIAPEKGLHVLAEAFQQFHAHTGSTNVRLEAAGYLAPAQQPYLAAVQQSLQQAGLGNQFHYAGTLNRQQKLEFFRTLDVLSVPTPNDEPKGFFLLEAMASGVPVAQPRRGAFTEIIEKTGGGLLTEPGSTESLAEALHLLWRDRSKRDDLGRRGFEGVRKHYTVARSVDRLLEVYHSMMSRSVPA